jgi:hypothetical protein
VHKVLLHTTVLSDKWFVVGKNNGLPEDHVGLVSAEPAVHSENLLYPFNLPMVNTSGRSMTFARRPEPSPTHLQPAFLLSPSAPARILNRPPMSPSRQ